MKKILLGIFIGIIITVLILVFHNLWCYYTFSRQITTRVAETAEISFEHALPDAQITGVGTELIHNNTPEVNYVYDKLYNVILDYKLQNKYRRIKFIIGVYDNHIIGPPEVDLIRLNDSAEIIYEIH